MRQLFVILIVMSVMSIGNSLEAVDANCKDGFWTVFEITACDGKPVENADVTITLCCGDKVKKKGLTDVKGRVAFSYFEGDICARALFGQVVENHRVNCLPGPVYQNGKAVCLVPIKVCGD